MLELNREAWTVAYNIYKARLNDLRSVDPVAPDASEQALLVFGAIAEDCSRLNSAGDPASVQLALAVYTALEDIYRASKAARNP